MSTIKLCPFLTNWTCERVRGVEPVDPLFCLNCLIGKMVWYLSLRNKEAEG